MGPRAPYDVAAVDAADEFDDATAGATAADTSSADEVQQTRAQIEETCSNMGETLGAIADRLDPQNLMHQAKETAHEVVQNTKEAVYDATVGRAQRAVGGAVDTVKDTGSTMMDTIKENPIPAALIGIGIGWLFLSARK